MSAQESTPVVAPVGGNGTPSPVKSLTVSRNFPALSPIPAGDGAQLRQSTAKNGQEKQKLSATPSSVNSSKTAGAVETNESRIEAELEALKAQIAEDRIEEALIIFGRRLEFSRDERTGEALVVVINQETNEILKRIPPGSIRDLLKDLGENLLGRFVKTQA